jgi:hypothetical protein
VSPPPDRLSAVAASLDGRWRTVRAGAFVLIAAQITALGHVAGGGSPPDLPLLATMSGLLLAALRSLTTRRRRFPVVLAAMSGTQVLFHFVLALSDAHTPSGATQPLRMLVFHVVAAVTAAALLAYGDQLLFALHGRLRRLLPRVALAAPIAVVATWTAIAERAGRRLRSRLDRSSISRRGPPAELAPSC